MQPQNTILPATADAESPDAKLSALEPEPSRAPVVPPLPSMASAWLPNRDRRYRTGRNQQINIKAKPETIERMNRYADAYGMPLGAILELALNALEEHTTRGTEA